MNKNSRHHQIWSKALQVKIYDSIIKKYKCLFEKKPFFLKKGFFMLLFSELKTIPYAVAECFGAPVTAIQYPSHSH